MIVLNNSLQKLILVLFYFSVAKLLTTVCATGGGAFKFEEEFKRVSKVCAAILGSK